MLDGCDPRHLAHEPVRVLHLLAVVVDQIRRLLGIAHRFDAGFADLEAHDRRELELTLAHQAGRAPQDRDAFPPAAVRPRGLRGPRSPDRAVHLRGVAAAKQPSTTAVSMGERSTIGGAGDGTASPAM